MASTESRTSAPSSTASTAQGDAAYRYDAARANEIERRWQTHWDANKTFATPNPTDPEFDPTRYGSKQYILDMFPYPSGVGLHVGHPLGYIATDIYARYLRAAGHHVLHAMGFDAFGLPAEQFAVEHGVHPRITTENNIASMEKQLRRLGLAHDPERSFATTDVDYYKWTQWIFLQIFNAWYDDAQDRARPISELIDAFESGKRECAHKKLNPEGRAWRDLDDETQRRIVDSYRLAYLDDVPVNWCPALGTVLANEEVTAEGRSERGNHPVYKRPLKQWMMRITKYAERLLHDIERVDWPEPIKLMQRNWIGRSEGAYVDFSTDAGAIRVYTTRPDTLFGATYMVLAPEHPLVDQLTTDAWPSEMKGEWKGKFPNCSANANSPKEVVAAYRRFAESKSDVERQIETREKTGVFIGAFATNPVNDERIPIFVADYVLMGYGTGAIMAVPGQDERDWEFAEAFDLPIVRTVQPPDDFDDKAYVGDGPAINSEFLNGLNIVDAKRRMIEWLEEKGLGVAAVQYKLRDWLFSRQRYWGEPFPIVYDESGHPIALDESQLPVELPALDDFTPHSSDDPNAMPQPPLARAEDWVAVEIDGKTYRRETNTMPQWAGSCWYYLRYLDPQNESQLVAPAIERYWMLSPKTSTTGVSPVDSFDPNIHHWGGVDLYVGGAEHAVLHLLYARFWHKVLFDLGHVSTPEPFGKLFNQGYIQAYAYTDARGVYVNAEEVEERDGRYFFKGEEVERAYGKMGKSLKNSVTPDEMCSEFGCDTLRLYEMYMGPLEQSKPWSTRDAVGSFRFLQRVWRNFVHEETGELRITNEPASDELRKQLHKTIAKVNNDMHDLAFNTAIAAMIELNNSLVKLDILPGEIAEPFVKMLAPFVPHFAEELWQMMGHNADGKSSITFEPFPVADEKYLVEDEVQLVVQVLGKVRSKLMVPADADEETAKNAALADENVQKHLEGRTIRKVIYVPGRLINFVAN